ncbi:MAG: heme biosynthesis HemY N-terminal domain-containing protein [Gallionellaceae bacterium]|nr:heme biosynthesis HemY N-terminal domain-containing protein [Gallionellaceae bacterium]
MRPILWLLLLFALAVAITLAARFDEGYVLVVIPPWRLEMSFVLAAVSMLALYGAIWLVVRILRLALSLPTDVRAWRNRRRSDKADDELTRAIAAYLSGQPAHAQKLATSAYKRERRPMAALVAAHAALAEGDRATASLYLDGLETDPGELTAARQAAEAKLAEAEVIAAPLEIPPA